MKISKIQKLHKLLEEHLIYYDQLIDYIAKEKELLLEMNLDGIFVSSRGKEELAVKIQNSVQLMIEAIKDVSNILNLSSDNKIATLGEIAEKCPKPYDNFINDGAIKLARLKNIMLRENQANRIFLEESLNILHSSINILTGSESNKSKLYSKDGAKENKKFSRPIKLSREV